MVIKTKYNIGQHIYKFDEGRIVEYKITTIVTGNDVSEYDRVKGYAGTFVCYTFQNVEDRHFSTQDFEHKMEGVYFGSIRELKKQINKIFVEHNLSQNDKKSY